MRTLKNVNWSAVAICLSVIAMIGYQSAARQQNDGAADPSPAASLGQQNGSVVRVLDIELLFNSLDRKREADAALQRMADQLESEGVQMREEIEQLKEDQEVLAPGTEQFKQTQEAWALKSAEYMAFVEFSRAKISVEKAVTLKKLYGEIKEAIEVVSERNGYDIVLIDDSIQALPPANEQEMMRQISARRMLYTSSDIDITNEIIAEMNATDTAAQPSGN